MMCGRRLVVAVEDPVWAMHVYGLLGLRDAAYSVYDYAACPRSGDVVYTDNPGIPRGDGALLFIDTGRSRRVFEKAFLASICREEYRSLTVAVDPGRRYTMVALGDEYLLHVVKTSNAWRIAGDIVYLRDNVPARRFHVKIGAGSNGEELYHILSRIIDSDMVSLVPEHGTSKKGRWEARVIQHYLSGAGSMRRDRDVWAALLIASRTQGR